MFESKLTSEEEICNILIESLWTMRWTENKEALYAVLTSEESEHIVENILNNLTSNGYTIIKNTDVLKQK